MGTATGLTQGAVADTSTQTVVDLSRFHENTSIGDLLTAFGDSTDTLGRPYTPARRSEIEIETTDLSGQSQLQTWTDNGTPVQMVAVGSRMVLQWYNSTPLQAHPANDPAVGNPERERLLYQREDGASTHDVYWAQNALFYNNFTNEAGFVDGGSGFPQGYDYTSGTLSSEAVSSGVYEAHGPTDGSMAERGDDVLMPLPVPQTWTLSVEVTQLHSDGDTAIALQALDTSSTVQASTETLASSTGRVSASITAPADTYELRAVVLRVKNASSQSAKAKVKEPALVPHTGTSYVTR